MARNTKWLSDESVETFIKLSETENLHPAIRSLLHAIPHLSDIKLDSLSRKTSMVNAYIFIIKAINEISSYQGSFVGLNIPDPRSILFNDDK